MMTTTSEGHEDSRTLTGLTEFYRDHMGPPSTAELDRGLDTFLARVTARKTRRRGWVRWSLVGATAALCALVAVEVTSALRKPVPSPQAPALTYRIEGGSVLEGGYLRESGQAGMSVLFNEGSQFSLTPGARGRIRVVDREGAHVAIERGTASFRVAQNAQRRWLIDVGPFLVAVKGTVFTVSWDPLSEQFDLRLRRGRVVVSGPATAGEIALRAGQRLVVNLAKVKTVITEEPPEKASPEPVSAIPLRAEDSPERSPSVVTNEPNGAGASSASLSFPPAKSPVDHRWGDALARGQWDRVLADVKRIGVQVTLGQASSEDLFALADAARYRHRPDLARAALLAARRRFPNSPRALDAIYLLGRVEESRASGTVQALTWYDEYLARAPTGPFVGEALGRKMTLTDRLEGPAGARAVAKEYLRRFPKGNYAGSALELLRTP